MTAVPVAVLGCPCGIDPGFLDDWSVDWHRRHRDHHLTVFPDVDQGTRDNLAWFIERAAAFPSPFVDLPVTQRVEVVGSGVSDPAVVDTPDAFDTKETTP